MNFFLLLLPFTPTAEITYECHVNHLLPSFCSLATLWNIIFLGGLCSRVNCLEEMWVCSVKSQGGEETEAFLPQKLSSIITIIIIIIINFPMPYCMHNRKLYFPGDLEAGREGVPRTPISLADVGTEEFFQKLTSRISEMVSAKISQGKKPGRCKFISIENVMLS